MNRKNECAKCGTDCDCDQNNHDGSYMVAQNLNSILKAVQEIIPLVGEHDDVESWMEHKISVAKSALSDVRDSLVYHKSMDSDCGMQDHGNDEEVDIEILQPNQGATDSFDLGKLLGAPMQGENNYFMGSGAINEKRQLITNKSSQKIVVESIKRSGSNLIVKTKSGKEYEYLPHFGAELEILRCEDYGIKIKK